MRSALPFLCALSSLVLTTAIAEADPPSVATIPVPAVPVRFEAPDPHVSLFAGWPGTPPAKVCEAPCSAVLPVGSSLAIREEGHTTTAVSLPPVTVTGPSRVVGHYLDRTPVRIAGGVILAATVIGGAVMIANSGLSAGCFDSDDGDDCTATNSHPHWAEGLSGFSLVLTGSTLGLWMLLQPNKANFEITPLQTASFTAGPPFRSEGALLRPNDTAEGLGVRVRF
jgi:hypothetical protein